MCGQNRKPCNTWTNWKINKTRRRLSGISGRKLISSRKLWICKSTGYFFFDCNDLSEEALRDADKRLRQIWNAYKYMPKEMVISPHFGKSNKARATDPSPPYHGSHTKESDKRKWRRKKKDRQGQLSTSQDMGSGEDFTIYEDKGSTEEEDKKESNEAEVKIADSTRTGSCGSLKMITMVP